MDKPTLLLSGGHTTRPLWNLLGEKYRLAFIDPGAAQLAAESRVPDVIAVGQYATPDTIEALNNVSTLLAAKVVNGLPAISNKLAAAYGDSRPHELNGHLENWFPGYIHHLLRPQVELLTLLDQLFQKQDIRGLVVHEDVTAMTRTAIEFCKKNGVPTIHIPHAQCHLLPGVPDIHREIRAEYVISSGAYETQWFKDNGLAADNIFESGNIGLDWFYTSDLPTKDEARKVLLLDRPVILYCASWPQTTSLRSGFEKEIETCMDAVVALAKKWECVLMVSLHPHDNPQATNFYASKMDQANVPGLVSQNPSYFNYLLRAADVMIAQGPSNACQHSALVGTPCCYFQTEGFDFKRYLPYRGQPEDLETFATQARDNATDWNEWLTYYNSAHPNGGASEKVVEYIEQLCPLQ